ncbi:hypothetical protein FRC10_010788 [Ceratobasidium sp. 414]|nr:hypothetical protein FRC10_010788 [Ceratobasidium sp. 414]
MSPIPTVHMNSFKVRGAPIEVAASRQIHTASKAQGSNDRKRGRDGPYHQDRPNKKKRFGDEFVEASPSLSSQSSGSIPQSSRNARLHDVDPGAEAQKILSKQSALGLAQQAVELATSKKRIKESDVSGAMLEQLKAERDEAIAQRDAAVESSRAFKQELRRLKKSVKEKDERVERVLRLVTASLRSLQEGMGEAG